MQPIFPNNLSLCRYKKQHLHGVFGFARSERHNVIATWGLEREAFVWNPYSQQPMAQLDGHGSSVMSVVFHDAADQVITASSVDKTVRIWCATTFTLTQVWGLGVWGLGLGFGVWGLGFGVWGLGLGFGVWGLEFVAYMHSSALL